MDPEELAPQRTQSLGKASGPNPVGPGRCTVCNCPMFVFRRLCALCELLSTTLYTSA